MGEFLARNVVLGEIDYKYALKVIAFYDDDEREREDDRKMLENYLIYTGHGYLINR